MPSTVIEKVVYDETNKVLMVRFLSGKVYYYYEVPKGVYLTLKMARSKGGYFNKYIKGNFDFEEYLDLP